MSQVLLREALGGHARAAEIVETMEAYVGLLLEHRTRSNLIGPMDEEAIYASLLLDALLPALAMGEGFAPPGPVLDIGSGAGLPGIPLAAWWGAGVPVHLVEPRQLRVAFLELALRELGLSQVRQQPVRIESLDPSLRGGFAVVAAKAFQPPARYLKTAAPWLRPGGLVMLYVSETSWTPEAQEASRRLGYEEAGRMAHPSLASRFGLVLRRAGAA